jgi:phosphoribosylamine--glycine ligase
MGSYAPVPQVGDADVDALVDLVHVPVLRELSRRGTPFVGTLFAGLMLTADGPRVLEFNCRFGDPETQSLLPLLDGDVLELLSAAARGELAAPSRIETNRAAVTVVLAARDYPAASDRGTPIEGVEAAESIGGLVFHAGPALHDGRLVTNGGRVRGVTGVGATIADARSTAYAAADLVRFDGARRRDDIALAASSVATLAPGNS